MASGVFLGHAAPGWGVYSVAVPMAAAGLLYAFRGHLPWRGHAMLAAVFSSAGAAIWLAHNATPVNDSLFRQIREHPREDYVLEGVVRESSLFLPGTDYGDFVLDVEQFASKEGVRRNGGLVVVRWSQPVFPVHPGERVRVSGSPSTYLSPVNHGYSGIEDALHRRGIRCVLRVRGPSMEKLGAPEWDPFYWTSRMRGWQGRLFERVLPADTLPFALAVWLGDRTLFRPEDTADFIASGTAHILSVSGVHMSMVYLSTSFLLGLCVPSRWLRALLISAAIILYTVMSGACVASLRAALMILLYLSAELFDRERDAPTALGLAAIILLFWDPDWLFDAGFQLSFASVASILLFLGWTPVWLSWVPRLIRANTVLCFNVQILPFPLAARYFHVMPLAGPIANLAVIPLTTACLWLCAAVVIAGTVLPPAEYLFGAALHVVIWCILWVVKWAAFIPQGRLALPSPTGLAMFIYWAGAWALYKGLRPLPPGIVGAFSPLLPKPTGLQRWLSQYSPQRRWLTVSGMLFLVAFCIWPLWFRPCGVDVLDVGHADSIFVRTPQKVLLLVDGGDRTEYTDSGRQIVLPYLYSNGVTRLDTVINTHPDSDHLGGLLTVIRRMPVRHAILGPASGNSRLETDFLDLCRQRGVEVRRVARGDDFDCGGARIEVLHPDRDDPAATDNNGSLVLRVSWPGFSMLLTGDIEHEAEAVLAQTDCRAMVLKAAHHGSATSNTGAFLDAVSPSLAVISTGPYRNASPVGIGVVERFQARSIPVWRTDHHGGIRILPENGVIRLLGARDVRGYTLGW